MVGRDKKNVSVLLARLENVANGLVSLSHTFNGSLVNTSVSDHIRRREIVHDKLELALADTLSNLLTHSGSAHLRLEIVCGDARRGDHIPLFTGELLLDTTVEEKGNVSVFFGLGDVALLDALLSEPFSKNVAHMLRRESNGELVIRLVLGHGGDVSVLGVREVWLGGAVVVTEQLGDFTDTVRAVVEEEERVSVYINR